MIPRRDSAIDWASSLSPLMPAMRMEFFSPINIPTRHIRNGREFQREVQRCNKKPKHWDPVKFKWEMEIVKVSSALSALGGRGSLVQLVAFLPPECALLGQLGYHGFWRFLELSGNFGIFHSKF